MLVENSAKLIKFKSWLAGLGNIEIYHDLVTKWNVVAVLEPEEGVVLPWLAWCFEIDMHCDLLVFMNRSLDHIRLN